MIYTRLIYLTLVGLTTALIAVSASKYDSAQAAEKEAETLAQTLRDNKQKALRTSILLAMYTQGEGEQGHTSTPCITRRNDTAMLDVIESDDVTYVCIITAQGGNVYEAEIELLTLAGEFIALPAMLTLMNGEES
ncbi:hypothetical protein EOL70_13605 [Leucothrix sargassi]|nr:hypothetical protein EOL70_13605 [Leucothrix sargassi]